MCVCVRARTRAKSMSLSESFQVVAIIQKISSSWKNSKNYLKHRGNEIRIEDLILRLMIEKNDKLTKKRINSSSALKVNVMEQDVRSHNKNKKSLL
jgi:hypothetical protein